jgi:hypothetical protein
MPQHTPILHYSAETVAEMWRLPQLSHALRVANTQEDNLTRRSLFPVFLSAIALVLLAMQCGFAQSASDVPVNMVVTVESNNGTVPDITREDVMAYQGRTRAKVTNWVAFQGDHAGLELFVVIDDVPSSSRGSQLEDLANFIGAQASTTKVGVAYLQQGAPFIAQALTTDHDAAAKALRASLGRLSRPDSPYFSLVDLIKQWPRGTDRREIVMLSNGADYEDRGFVAQDNPFVNPTIDLAQREGIVIFTISTRGPGHYLSRLADETGGRLYYQASGAAVSIVPYLNDTVQRLDRQYLLTFLVRPDKQAGLQSVKIKTEVPHAKLVSADKVYVPSAQP